MHYNVDFTNGALKIRLGGTKKEAAEGENPSPSLAGLKLVSWKLLIAATNSRKKADKYWRSFYEAKIQRRGDSQFWSIDADDIRSWVYYQETSDDEQA